MIFADPRNDVAFKKIFGDENKTEILISFLNSVLDFTNDKQIVKIDIVSSEQVPKIEEMKLTILDLKATNQEGEKFIIEMQKRDAYDFTKRSLYYTSKAYVQQLDRKQNYINLKKVYYIGILNFNMFDNKDYISRHLILNKKTLTNDLDDFEFTFIELDKFDKQLNELNTILDKWIYFLKNAAELEMIPNEFKDIKEFEEAFMIATQYKWNKKELAVYDYIAMKEIDEINAIEKAKNKAETIGMKLGEQKGIKIGEQKGMKIGEKKGMKIGEKKGMKIGEKKGMKIGEKKRSIEIAKSLLDVLDINVISKKTGLSIEDILKLKE